MGEPMAKNLHKAGHCVTVFNRTASRCEGLRSLGVAVAQSEQQVILASEAIILMVPSHVEVDKALQRMANGTIAAPVKGKTIILMSTVAPTYSTRLGASLALAGARYVEAPVSGSQQPAEAGQLVVLAAAAEPCHIDDVQPLFDAVGKKTVRCGVIPTAMRMKLANQLLLIAYFEAITEATHFAKGIGLDVAQFLEMAEAGPLANDVLRVKSSKMLVNDFSPQAPIRHVAKDIGLVCDEAEQRRLWVPVAEVNRTLFSEAMRRGLGQHDVVGVVNVLRTGQ
jgi:3-hydroxyisobutyrate dehydrogenase